MATHTVTFRVTAVVIVTLDDKVIAAVDDDWRRHFYNHLCTPRDIAEHVAFNKIVRGTPLSGIDGFANLADGLAEVDVVDDIDFEAD